MRYLIFTEYAGEVPTFAIMFRPKKKQASDATISPTVLTAPVLDLSILLKEVREQAYRQKKQGHPVENEAKEQTRRVEEKIRRLEEKA
ncbi:hypothetical protein EVAR_96253_1 [Eumeta japonica]|uniref:Uncharacterized protein n=1 Tax=Eumeta variegata TaxID=151549 RepID=A0A4C1WMI9_EUMVA|nr:hypothetical protein EVAR_96253_1 [Eumeta japonica]